MPLFAIGLMSTSFGLAARSGGARPAYDPRRGDLGPRVVPALVDHDLQRGVRFLVDLDRPVVRRGGGRDMAPAVRLERGAIGLRETVRLDAALVEESGRFDGGRFDDGGPAVVEAEPGRDRHVFELAALRPRRTGRSGARGQG